MPGSTDLRTANTRTLWTYNLPGFSAERALESPSGLFGRFGGMAAFVAQQLAAQENRAAADAATRSATDAATTTDSGVLTRPMAAFPPGAPVPVAFGRRRAGGTGGVLVQPQATEIGISNTATTYTVAWHCVLGEGQIPGVQVRDVRNGLVRDGAFSQRFDGRAGAWFPGNRTTPQPGQELPAFPLQCGGGGDYRGLTTIEFRNTYPAGSQRWSQVWNVFLRGGMIIQRGRLVDSVVGPSDNICDLLVWALVQSGRLTIDDIDLTAMATAAQFVEANALYCNAEFRTATNLPELLTTLLPSFLLRETTIGGKFAVLPLVPTNDDGTINTDPISPELIFTEQSIAPGSYQETYPAAGSRGPLELVISYRQQISEVEPPLTVALTLGRPDEANPTTEALDLSGFCTGRQHAAMAGAYRLATRQYGGRTGSVVLPAGDQTGFLWPGMIVQTHLHIVTDLEPPGRLSSYWTVDRVDRAIDGSETLQLSEVPVDEQGRSIVARQVILARDLAGDVVFPYPAIGGQDLPGRSSDTSVPAETSNPAVVPFSGGGSGVTGAAGSPGAGTGGRVELPPPAPPGDPAAPTPEDSGPATRTGGDPPPAGDRGRTRGNPPERPGEPPWQGCAYGPVEYSAEVVLEVGSGVSTVATYGPMLGQFMFRLISEVPNQNTDLSANPLTGQTYVYGYTDVNGGYVSGVMYNYKGGPFYADSQMHGDLIAVPTLTGTCLNRDGSAP